jgi:2-polyprenyl-3-methyl-5-hydroxy-6-metoxy-1,4-benzoquinol methylase
MQNTPDDQLRDIIRHVNRLCRKDVFNYEDMSDGLNYIWQTYPKIRFFDHGGTTICFLVDDTKKIIKLCKKNNHVMMHFQEYINLLIQHQLTISSDIVFENNHCLVYIQDYIHKVHKVTPIVVRDIICAYRRFIEFGIKVKDSCHKNFGYHLGKIRLFDIHDFDELDTKDNSLNVLVFCNLFHLMKFNCEIPNITYGKIIENNYYEEILGELYSSYLKTLNNNNFIALKEIEDQVVSELSNEIRHEYKNYQTISINSSGTISLYESTLEKYNVCNKLFTYIISSGEDPMTIKSILDAGCSIGGIGLKLAQLYPHLTVTLNNMTQSELEIATTISQHTAVFNINKNGKNLIALSESYDITLYFSILHHMLKHHSLDEVMSMVRSQTKKYSVIEIPLKGDALLTHLAQDKPEVWNDTFTVFDNVDTFCNFLQGIKFKIIDQGKMNYQGSNDLNRWYFLVKVN